MRSRGGSAVAGLGHGPGLSAVCGAAGAFFALAAGGVVAEVVPAGLRHAADALLKTGQDTVKVAGSALGGVLASGFAAGLMAGAALALLWKPRRVGVVVCTGTGSMAVPPAAVVPLSVLVAATGVAGTGPVVGVTV